MDINLPVTQRRYQRHLPGITQAPSISRTRRSGTRDKHLSRWSDHLSFDTSFDLRCIV